MIARAALFRLLLLFASNCCTSATLAASDLDFGGISLTPLSRVVPGGMLILQATVGNPGDSLAEGTIVVSLEALPKLQSPRRVVLEPGQQEKLELFVQMPETIQGLESIQVTATMMVRNGERDVILERNGTPARHTLTLEVAAGRTQ